MRKPYLDNIRWATQILVVIYHVLFMYNSVGVLGGLGKITSLDVQYYDIYLYAVYPWFMLLLFMVSGICSRLYLENHTHKEFIKSRTVRLLVPSTIGLFAFQFLQGAVSMALSGAFDSMGDVPLFVKYLISALSGTGVLWYMQLLWIFSLVLVLVRLIEKDRLWNLCARANVIVIILLAAVVWAASQILNTPVVIVYRFGYYGSAFFLGYFVFSHDEVIERLKKWFWVFALAALALGIAFTAVYFGQNYAEQPINRSMLFTLFGYFASVAVLGTAARFCDRENGFTRWMTRRSTGLYVFHYLGISCIALFVAKNQALSVPSWAVYALSLVAGFAAGFGLNEIISRLPFFRWAVLGISRKKVKGKVSFA